MHVLPRVAELHRRFERELVVIGVHAGKFPAERSTARIRSACARLGVTHPVVNDRQFHIWRSFAVQAWPTVVLVSPDGKVVGSHAGEFRLEDMAAVVQDLAGRSRAAGTLDEAPREFGADPAALAEPAGALRYPGRVLGDGERLFVADTGHHRILELRMRADRTGASVVRAFGNGRPALADGAADAASFREPQGLALRGDTLYVADRANHALRSIDLVHATVATIAGTGGLADDGIHAGPGTATALRSPWGVTVSGDALLVAMAGAHQIWRLDLDRADIAPLAGSGGEAMADGPGSQALLAQPMGIDATAEGIAFCDAESSAVRTLGADSAAEVRTVVGTGLFDFGDVDGTGDRVRLQHVEDVAWTGDGLVVADTYNDKVKMVDPVGRGCHALPGEAGSGSAFSHPAGIAWDGDRVLVADTDAHRIAIVDVATGAVSTLEIS